MFAGFRAGWLSAYTFNLHFSRLRLMVFIRFYCVWSFLKLHRSCRNAGSPFEAGVQFLQAINALSSRGFLYYVLALEFWTFDRSLLDGQLLTKSRILQYLITSANKQTTK
jgi:hypothetical protein